MRSDGRQNADDLGDFCPFATTRRRRIIAMAYGHGYNDSMKTIAAGKFKDVCLKTLDQVAETRTPVVITKRGRPVATLVPYVAPMTRSSLAGSVVREVGDPYGTGERWDADAS